MKTLHDKIWEAHRVCDRLDGTSLMYIDRHLLNEVTSPQAFEGLALAGRTVRSPKSILGVSDHNVPTTRREHGITDDESRMQVEALAENCRKHSLHYFDLNDQRQGIVHVIGPEQGFKYLIKSYIVYITHISQNVEQSFF